MKTVEVLSSAQRLWLRANTERGAEAGLRSFDFPCLPLSKVNSSSHPSPRWKLGAKPASRQLLQIVHNVRAGPIRRADEFAHNLAVAVDHERLRKLEGAVEFVVVPGVADGEQINVVVLDELLVGVVVVVLADGEDDNLVAELLLQLHQRRHLLDAGRAPRRPEVEHHGLAAELAERNGVLSIGDGEVGRGAADARRMRTAVAGSKQNQANQGSSGEETLHTPIIIHGTRTVRVVVTVDQVFRCHSERSQPPGLRRAQRTNPYSGKEVRESCKNRGPSTRCARSG